MLFVASNALAWGQDGHRVVCQIAYELLDSDAQRAEVDRLAEAYELPNGLEGYTSFAEACTFADRARSNAVAGTTGWEPFKQFSSWHFLNVPRSVKHVAASYCNDNCVVYAIAFHSSQLGQLTAGDQKRAEALIFLGHWVGDAHQPLHVSFADDQGGNKVTVHSTFFKQTNLHSVWDGGVIGHDEGAATNGWKAYADRLKKKITPEQQTAWLAVTTPLDWSDESYAITTTEDVQYCHFAADGTSCDPIHGARKLTSAYQEEFQPDVEQRLQQAGVRLAALIRQNLGK